MKKIVLFFINLIFIPYIIVFAIISRFNNKKKINVGIGPEPIVSHKYHKQALEKYSYTAQTFVHKTYYITNEFDIDLTRYNKIVKKIKLINLAFKYDILIFYFHGGPLSLVTFKFLEPYYYKFAGIKTILLPYGSDIQEMSRSKNVLFKNVLTKDYKNTKNFRQQVSKRIDRWTIYADYIISGCEWVDYMYHWDMLTLSHFSIDIYDEKFVVQKKKSKKTFKIFHAPNHKNIKGTQCLVDAVKSIKNDGYDVELILKTKVSNNEVIETIHECNIVADQFIVGWYAMFALEAMSCKKPVLCYLREDLIDLYVSTKILQDEIPIINTNIKIIKEKILWCMLNKDKLNQIGEKSYEFVKKYHSIEVIGSKFDAAIKSIEGKL